MKEVLQAVVMLGGMAVLVGYLFFLLLDVLFDFDFKLSYRLKKRKDGYHVQGRSLFSPFWFDIGMGTLDGMLFEPYILKKDFSAKDVVELTKRLELSKKDIAKLQVKR